MSESFKILQWNCRGIGANLTDLQLLLSQNVHVACLQETRLHHNSLFSIKHYSAYNYNPNTPNDSSPSLGGISILVHSSIPHASLHLNTSLQAQAIKISLDQTVTICNISIPHTPPLQNKTQQISYINSQSHLYS